MLYMLQKQLYLYLIHYFILQNQQYLVSLKLFINQQTNTSMSHKLPNTLYKQSIMNSYYSNLQTVQQKLHIYRQVLKNRVSDQFPIKSLSRYIYIMKLLENSSKLQNTQNENKQEGKSSISYDQQNILNDNIIDQESTNQHIHKKYSGSQINGYIQGLMDKRVPMNKIVQEHRCLKWQFIPIPKNKNPQFMCNIGLLSDSPEKIIKQIIGTINQGNILLLVKQYKNGRQIYGKIMKQQQKQKMNKQLKNHKSYILPEEISKALVMEYIPFKEPKKQQFIEGCYALRIYAQNLTRKLVAYYFYKGGKLKDLGKFKIYHYDQGQACPVQKTQIYNKLIKSLTKKQTRLKLHYNLPCDQPDIGKIKRNDDQNVQIAAAQLILTTSLPEKKFQYYSYVIVNKKSDIEAISHKLTLHKLRFQMQSNDPQPQSKKKILGFIYHEDKISLLREYINQLKLQIKIIEVPLNIFVRKADQYQNQQNQLINNLQQIFPNTHKFYTKIKYQRTTNNLFLGNKQCLKQISLILQCQNRQITAYLFMAIFQRFDYRNSSLLDNQSKQIKLQGVQFISQG